MNFIVGCIYFKMSLELLKKAMRNSMHAKMEALNDAQRHLEIVEETISVLKKM